MTPATNNIKVTLDWTPLEDSGDTHYLWSSYSDASNYIAILYDGTDVIFRKRISGTNYDATKTTNIVLGTTYAIVAELSSTGGVDVSVDAAAGTGHANTTNAVVGSTVQIGSLNSGDQSTAAIKNVKYYTVSASDTLLADNVESATAVSIPDVGQKHVILANDVESSSEVSTPAVGQEHALLANNVESVSEVSSPAATESNILLAEDVESASEVSQPDVGQGHVLLADDVESASEVSSPAVGQIHVVLADDVESASNVSVPTLVDVPAGTHALLAEDVESSSELSIPAINQVHALLVNDVESISEVSTPQLGPVSTTPVFRPPSGGSGGGTGRKYKKALRNSRPKKARIGRLEDVTLPSPKIAEEDRLIEEAVKETIKTVVKEAKETSPKLSLKELLSIAASTRESLKKKEKLERLRRLIRIIHIRKEASKRRKKKAQLEAQRLLEEEVRKELERETARRIAEAERKKKEREEQDLRDLMAIIKVVLEAA